MLIIYSNNCPKCRLLKRVLDGHDLQYEESSDFKPLIVAGFRSLPVLQTEDGTRLRFEDAMQYINEQRG